MMEERRKNTMILYRNMRYQQLFDDMCSLLKPEEGGARPDAYACASQLIDLAVTYGFRGNLWHCFLAFCMANNENAYSTSCEIIGPVGGSLSELARHDFAQVRELFSLDIARLDEAESGIWSEMKHYENALENSKAFNHRIRDRIVELSVSLENAESDQKFQDIVTEFYKEFGVGKFGLNKAFHIIMDDEAKQVDIEPITRVEHIELSDLVGYELQKAKLLRDQEIRRIFTGESDKFVVLVGPCSADNEDTVCEYVNRLKQVADKVSDKLLIIPRVYPNKPRTTGDGYKGRLHQPDPDQAPNLLEGIIAIRRMHIRAIKETGLTSADEMLYPENRSYLDDILSYEAIGARSVENQQHRLTASGMDIPVGMKNPTSGDFSVMMNSVIAAQNSHNFIYRGMDVTTEGNDLAHVILRGGVDKYGTCIPNYHYEDLVRLVDVYAKKDLKNPAAIIDANHSNSNKQFKEQIRIVSEILHSRRYNDDVKKMVKGVMIESYIEEGNQKICDHMTYGKSITDPCLGWEDTEKLIYKIAEEC